LAIIGWAYQYYRELAKKFPETLKDPALVQLCSLDGCHALGFGDGQEGGWVILDCGYEILISRRHTPTCADILAWSDLTGQIFHSIRKNQINSCLFSLYI